MDPDPDPKRCFNLTFFSRNRVFFLFFLKSFFYKIPPQDEKGKGFQYGIRKEDLHINDIDHIISLVPFDEAVYLLVTYLFVTLLFLNIIRKLIMYMC